MRVFGRVIGKTHDSQQAVDGSTTIASALHRKPIFHVRPDGLPGKETKMLKDRGYTWRGASDLRAIKENMP